MYSALLKYQIIIEDIYYFDEYLEQLEKLFKKLDNFNDICLGINRLIGSICASKLGIKNVEENKEEVLRYIYDKYIVDGYFVHGYSSCYEDSIKDNGFDSESPLLVNKDYMVIDGAHRMACALYFNIDDVFIKTTDEYINFIPNEYTKKWFEENNLSECIPYAEKQKEKIKELIKDV